MAPAPKPTANWEKVGDRYYRKVQLYSTVFDPDVELENYLIAGAPYSGALALHRDPSKIYAFQSAEAARSTIEVYSCAGALIRSIEWDKGPIKGLGWSEDETLLVVAQNGHVRAYGSLSDDFTPFSLGEAAEAEGVLSVRFYPTGLVALLADNSLISVTDYSTPQPKALAQPPQDEVVSWALIPPSHSLSRAPEALLAIKQSIAVVDATDAEDRMLSNGPFRHTAVSPNGRFIALYTDDARVWVISADFQEKLTEYETKVRSPPKDLQWCGNDAVVLAWEDEIHLVGPNGSAARYYYDSWVHLLPDVDGLRVLTNESLEFLQRVPDVTVEALSPGSSSPAAILLDAVTQLELQSPKADDNIQMIRPRLVDAVDDCIAAAGHEYDVYWQKQLFKAASFGKTVLDHYDPEEYVGMLDATRVLNAVRFFEIGLPMSYDQYLRLGPERLIQRLVTRRQYLLALRLSETLKLSTDTIYNHWACEKVVASADSDDVVCQSILAKLASHKGVAYDRIAKVAFDEGRVDLASAILEKEPLASKQVTLLLEMAKGTLALDKAIESGDNDLVLVALLALRQKLPLATFFRTINTRPVASALVEATSRLEDRDLLKDFYYQDDRRLDGALLLFTDALSLTDAAQTQTKLRSAAKLLADSKDLAPQAKIVEEASRLLKAQEALDADESLRESSRHTFSGEPLNDTVYHLIQHGHSKRALKLQSDFKLPDRTFWWLRLRALVAARAWRELEDLGSKNKKSPIGWEPFFEEILAAGNSKLAGGVFVPKCSGVSVKERVAMYVKCGMVVRAGEEAAKAGDVDLLEELRGQADGREEVEIERLRAGVARARR